MQTKQKQASRLDLDACFRVIISFNINQLIRRFCYFYAKRQTIKFKTDDFVLAFNNYQQIKIPKNQVFESDTILCLTDPATYKHNLYLYDKKTQNYYFIMRAYI